MLKNSAERYGIVSRLLHWSIALLIFGLVALGWYMVDLTYYDRWYYTSLSAHKALGILVLELAILKILWSLYSRPPEFAPTLKPWERISARIMHGVLYLMMILIPVTGYIISTSAGDPVSFFGWYQVPALFPKNEGMRDLAIELHYYLAYGTAVLAALHGLAALKHHFIDRDGTLRKMI